MYRYYHCHIMLLTLQDFLLKALFCCQSLLQQLVIPDNILYIYIYNYTKVSKSVEECLMSCRKSGLDQN